MNISPPTPCLDKYRQSLASFSGLKHFKVFIRSSWVTYGW